MKSKILILFSALIVLAGCGAQADKKFAKIALTVEAQQADNLMKGRQVDYITTCISCVFDGKDLIYNYEIDEDAASLSDIDSEMIKASLLESWKTMPQLSVTKQNLNILDGSVIYNYTGSKTKETFTIKFKPPKDSEEEE